MNKILLTSICSLTVSVPSGFLIYYLSGSSSEQYSLSELSVSDNGDLYLFGTITNNIVGNVSQSTTPLTFNCAMSSGKTCHVKVLNREALMKEKNNNVLQNTNLFIDATKNQLIKGAYVQINLKKEGGNKKITKTETITINNTNETFTVKLENQEKNSALQSTQEKFVHKIIAPQDVDDVDNTRYCLIKFPESITINDGYAWLFPRNKDNNGELTWDIEGADENMKNDQYVEIYEIADQEQANGSDVQKNKQYFDTQKKFIQTIDVLQKQKGQWVKMVTKEPNISCAIRNLNANAKDNSQVLVYDDNTLLKNYEMKEGT